MFTYKFHINTQRKNNLMLRITNNRKKSEAYMGLQLTQAELDSSLSGTSRNTRLEKLLASWVSQIKSLMLELADRKESDMDAKEILMILQERLLGVPAQNTKEDSDNRTFMLWFQRFIDSKTNKGTKGVYKHTLNRILLFDSEVGKKTFEDIDLQWLTDFEAFCAKTASKNARNIHLRNIRAVFNNAIDFDVTTSYPFRRFKVRPEATRKRSLTIEKLRELLNYECEPADEPHRDIFLLIFTLIGMNIADLHSATHSQIIDGRLEYRRAKTHKLYSIKLEPEAISMIEKYAGKKKLISIAERYGTAHDWGRRVNKGLRRIGPFERKGLGGKKIIKPLCPELTTYWARHSWATIAASLDIPRDTIAHALGHGGNTVTDIYIDFDQKKVDEANRKVLDWVLYGKK